MHTQEKKRRLFCRFIVVCLLFRGQAVLADPEVVFLRGYLEPSEKWMEQSLAVWEAEFSKRVLFLGHTKKTSKIKKTQEDSPFVISREDIPVLKNGPTVLVNGHGNVSERFPYGSSEENRESAIMPLIQGLGEKTMDALLAIQEKMNPSHWEICGCHQGALVHDLKRHAHSFRPGATFIIRSSAKYPSSSALCEKSLHDRVSTLLNRSPQERENPLEPLEAFAARTLEDAETMYFVQIPPQQGDSLTVFKATAPKHYAPMRGQGGEFMFFGSAAYFQAYFRTHARKEIWKEKNKGEREPASLITIEGKETIQSYQRLLSQLLLEREKKLEDKKKETSWLPYLATLQTVSSMKNSDSLNPWTGRSAGQITEALRCKELALELESAQDLKAQKEKLKIFLALHSGWHPFSVMTCALELGPWVLEEVWADPVQKGRLEENERRWDKFKEFSLDQRKEVRMRLQEAQQKGQLEPLSTEAQAFFHQTLALLVKSLAEQEVKVALETDDLPLFESNWPLVRVESDFQPIELMNRLVSKWANGAGENPRILSWLFKNSVEKDQEAIQKFLQQESQRSQARLQEFKRYSSMIVQAHQEEKFGVFLKEALEKRKQPPKE